MRNPVFYDHFNPGPAMPHDPVTATIASALISTVGGAIMKPKTNSDGSAQNAAALADQKKLRAQEQAIQLRQQNQANADTTKLDGNLAALQAAALQRRSGAGGLSYTGASTELKQTFGG